ncbi:MAG: ATP-binding cassette domain-containing protein, partial [Miltoncostaeaceae bacterium]
MDILSLDLALPLRSFELRVDLRVAGETLAVVGPSGAGKSSLLRAVAGLVEPTRGRVALGDAVWFDGRDGTCLKPE